MSAPGRTSGARSTALDLVTDVVAELGEGWQIAPDANNGSHWMLLFGPNDLAWHVTVIDGYTLDGQVRLWFQGTTPWRKDRRYKLPTGNAGTAHFSTEETPNAIADVLRYCLMPQNLAVLAEIGGEDGAKEET